MKQSEKKKAVIKNAHTLQQLKKSGERLVSHEGEFMTLRDILAKESEQTLPTK
ncbi:hypothetical protein GJJ30_20050 [Larkinella terrae]|uniref:Uncharacterized protein n=1 Tax=Larkinella terrae TaxID=2025311 RepID=A0A7K0EP70_9BACT|nr:hypothetical protein [Larkinella terrae]